MIGRETVIVGDVVRGDEGSFLVSWCEGELPQAGEETRCFMSVVRPGRTSARARRPVFRTPGLCGSSRLRLALVDGGVVGATACSDRPGTWTWAELYARSGEARSVPLPVAPVPDSEQMAPVPVRGPTNGFWIVWTEARESHRGEGTVRGARLDSRGEPVGGVIDLSRRDAAVTSTVGTRFAVAGLPGGGLAVVWSEPEAEGVAARLGIFDAVGRSAGPPIDFESGRLNPLDPLRVATDASGRITVAWWRKGDPVSGPARLHAAAFTHSGEALAPPAPVTPGPSPTFPTIAAVGSSDRGQVIAWADRNPKTGERRIGLRRLSPERGPLGLTTWLDGAVTGSWPFLELVPGDEGGRFTLYWKETVDDPVQGLTAVLRWQELEIPD